MMKKGGQKKFVRKEECGEHSTRFKSQNLCIKGVENDEEEYIWAGSMYEIDPRPFGLR